MVSNIVERIRQNDQRAMGELYQMYIGELSSVCYRYIPNRDDAKDVLQNSFVKIFTSISTMEYRGNEAFKGWLVRIVANEALKFLREKKKLLFIEQDEAKAQQARIADETLDTEMISADQLHQLISELPDGNNEDRGTSKGGGAARAPAQHQSLGRDHGPAADLQRGECFQIPFGRLRLHHRCYRLAEG